jgi:hypothetical protein
LTLNLIDRQKTFAHEMRFSWANNDDTKGACGLYGPCGAFLRNGGGAVAEESDGRSSAQV